MSFARFIALSLPVAFVCAIHFDSSLSPAAQQKVGEEKNSLGKTIADFTLKDTSGRAVSLAQFKDKKAVAVVFLGTQCPINNLYLLRLAELHKEFSGQDVEFLAVN